MTAERLRLFVALELPDEVRDVLCRWQALVLADQPPLRAVEREALHVTLCFLGLRPARDLDRITAACRSAAGMPARDLSLDAAAWLPRRRPRVLAVRIADPRAQLRALQRQLSAALVQAGVFEPERRTFLAHVTVARVRRDLRLSPAEPEVPDVPAARPFAASAVTLYRSHLGRGPARYDAIHRASLDDR